MTWVLVLWLGGRMTSVPGFHSERACIEAGESFLGEREHWYSAGRAWWCIEVR